MRKLFLILLFVFPSLAFATTKNVYVNTDCSNNGTGSSYTCAASAGAAGAYNTLDNAKAGEIAANADLVTATTDLWVHCKGATEDASSASWTGFTTSATYQLHLTVDTAYRHQGVKDVTKYRLSRDTGTNATTAVLHFCPKYGSVEGFQIFQKHGGATAARGLSANDTTSVTCSPSPSGGKLVFRDNLIGYEGYSGTTGAHGISVNGASLLDFVATQNIIYSFPGSGIVNTTTNSGTTSIQANTIYASVGNVGVQLTAAGTSDALNLYNNSVKLGAGTNYSLDSGNLTTFNHASNSSYDTSSPDATLRSVTPLYVSLANNDYRLSGLSTSLINVGTDRSANADYCLPGSTPCYADIKNIMRDQSPDVGASEVWLPANGLISLGEYKRSRAVSTNIAFGLRNMQTGKLYSGLSVSCSVCQYSDGAAPTTCTTTITAPTEISTASGYYNLPLSTYETAADLAFVVCNANTADVIPVEFSINTIESTRSSDGLLQAATSSTAQLAASETYSDDVFNNTAALCIAKGTGAGQCRTITDYASSTKTASISPSWTITPDTTSSYYIAGSVGSASTITDKANYSLASSQTFNLTGNITGNITGSVGTVTSVSDKTGYAASCSLGTDAVTPASVSAAAGSKIADIILRRNTSNVEGSLDGDTIDRKSLLGAVAQQTHKVAIIGDTMTTYRSDGATVLGSRTVSSSSAAAPITGVGN